MPSKTQIEQAAIEPDFVTIEAGCQIISAISVAEMYRAARSQEIESVKAGKRTLLTVASLKAHAASLPPAKIKPPTTRRRKAK